MEHDVMTPPINADQDKTDNIINQSEGGHSLNYDAILMEKSEELY